MDIYQIWTTYNKQWSRHEILAFGLVLTVVCIGMAVCVYRKEAAHRSGIGSRGIGGVSRNCIWLGRYSPGLEQSVSMNYCHSGRGVR